MTIPDSSNHTPLGPLNTSTPRKKPTLTALALTSLLTASAGAFGVPATLNLMGTDALIATAHADVLPVSPNDPQGAQRWVNPDLRTTDNNPTIGIELREAPATIRLGDTLTVGLRITNNSDETISTASSQLSILPKHADAQTSVAGARSALAQDPDTFSYFGRLIPVQEALGDDVNIAPGEAIDISVDIPTSADVRGGINITDPGFYPILLGVHTANGTEATQRYLLSVLGTDPDAAPSGTHVPADIGDHLSPRAAQLVTEAAESAAASAASQSTQPDPQDPADNAPSPQANEPSDPAQVLERAATPLSVVVPITANVNIVPGETGEAPAREQLILADDSLAEQLRPGGRIATLVSNLSQVLEGNEKLSSATCLAIDPQLVDALDRMSRGYIVSADRPSSVSQKQRLRDSWWDNDNSFVSEPGTGSDDARAVLNELRSLVESKCNVALPWANADLNAVANAANNALMREAVTRGQEVLARVLNATPVTNVVVSPHGYITEAAARLVGWADVSGFLSARDAEGAGTGSSVFSVDDVAAYQWSQSEPHSTSQDPDRSSDRGSAGDGSVDDVDSTAQDHNALNSASSDDTSHSAAAPVPQAPVRVLVANNTLWDAPKADRFAVLGPRVTAVGYDAGLSQVLAEASESPQTVAYGPYDARFDLEADSLSARSATAQSALRMAVDEANGLGNQEPRPVLAMLPAITDDGDNAISMLNAAANLLETGQAAPLGLRDYVAPNPAQVGELSQLAQSAAANTTQANRFGAPYDDPTAISDTEVLGIRQQVTYMDDLTSLMVNDPQLALTPYGFTAPLRQDLLRALSYTGRNEATKFDDRVSRTESISTDNREVLMELRESVALLPPGNVYTRISDSSPLLIVARNGLPLPVNAYLRYTGPEDSQLSIPSPLIIPAKGSMTVSMTANLPDQPDRTNLSLWLATSQDAGISAPVDITVQTQKGLSSRSGIAIGLVIALAIVLLGRVLILRNRKKNARLKQEQHHDARSAGRSARPSPGQRAAGVPQAAHDAVARRRRQPHRGGDKSTGDSREPK